MVMLVEAKLMLEGSKMESWLHILAKALDKEVGMVEAYDAHIGPN